MKRGNSPPEEPHPSQPFELRSSALQLDLAISVDFHSVVDISPHYVTAGLKRTCFTDTPSP